MGKKPPTPAGNDLLKITSIRLPVDLYKQVQTKAHEQDVSISQWLRGLVETTLEGPRV